ncbi:MAG: membrane protein insertion efficiency factor YidD [Pseudomonadota bacterium]
MSRPIIYVFLLFLILIYAELPTFAGVDPFRGPWGEASFVERDLNNQAISERVGDESTLSRVLIRGIKFFQEVISPVDGDRCPMYPTCSEYGSQAIRKHGAFLGSIMIADRLIHERDEMRYAPRVIVHGTYRYYDPVEYNDFWFNKK